MKMFFSGQYYKGIDPYIHRRLYSYFYHPCNPDLSPNKDIQEALDRGNEVFLDSGAFSAFTQGVDIDINQYTEHCIKHDKDYAYMAALDVIGNAESSYANYTKQKEQGARIFPTFHFGEPFDFLDTLIEESDMVGLGGVAQLGTGPKLYEWLDACFEHLCTPDGYPKVKIHGFALTSIDVIKRYPFYCVDSTAWVFAGAMGKLVFLQNEELYVVSVTDENPTAENIRSKHWNHLSDTEKDMLHKLAGQRHVTIDECKVHAMPRGIFNIHTYQQFEELGTDKLLERQDTLF